MPPINMRSSLFCFSTGKDNKAKESDFYGYDQKFGIDYFGDEYTENMVERYNYLNSIFPSFIEVHKDGSLDIAPDAGKQFKTWVLEHVKKVRQWQDARINRFNQPLYYLSRADVCTEKGNFEEVNTLFFLDREVCTYNDIITWLTHYSGQTLYVTNIFEYTF